MKQTYMLPPARKKSEVYEKIKRGKAVKKGEMVAAIKQSFDYRDHLTQQEVERQLEVAEFIHKLANGLLEE